MYRIDKNGLNVTDREFLWCADDFEITTSQYKHPDITSGQHTNGAANVFARRNGGEWVLSPHKAVHKTIAMIVEHGLHALGNAR